LWIGGSQSPHELQNFQKKVRGRCSIRKHWHLQAVTQIQFLCLIHENKVIYRDGNWAALPIPDFSSGETIECAVLRRLFFVLWFARYCPCRRSLFRSIYHRIIALDLCLFPIRSTTFLPAGVPRTLEGPGSNKQDIGEKMKRTPDHRLQKLRINETSKLARVRVRGAVLKNRSGH
jgi:hypothetical protein